MWPTINIWEKIPKRFYINFQKKLQSLGFKSNDCIILAYSGGSDSTFLLYALSSLKQWNFHIIPCYFNHQLREKHELEQEKEILFYNSQQCRVKLVYQMWEDPPQQLQNIEGQARIARYQFLEHCWKKYQAHSVVLAHHRQDHQETIAIRLLSGSVFYGLTGIKEHREIFFRPLLDFDKAWMQDRLDDFSIPYSQDSSNQNDHYQRNKFRAHLQPTLDQYFPQWSESMEKLAHKVDQIQKYLCVKMHSYLDDPYEQNRQWIYPRDLWEQWDFLEKEYLIYQIYDLCYKNKDLSNNRLPYRFIQYAIDYIQKKSEGTYQGHRLQIQFNKQQVKIFQTEMNSEVKIYSQN